MTRPIPSNFPFVLVVAVALSGFSARQSLAGGETCVTCGATRICLEWSQGDPPEQGTDFAVDCTVPPDIELASGDPEWRIDSWDTEIFERASIGVLTIDPTAPAGIFDVTIANDTGGPGAKNIVTIGLVAGAPWVGHSSIAGSWILGDLGRLLVQQDGAGNGGEVDLRVGGDVTGPDVVIPDLVSLIIEGELKAGATIDFQGQTLNRPLTIEGGGAGTITNIGDIFASTVILANGSAQSWDGTITVNNSVFGPGSIRTTIGGHVGGVINVNNNLHGPIVIDGDMSGEINVGGDITRSIHIQGTTRGDITVNGDVIATNITLTGGLEGGTLTVVGDVPHFPPLPQPIIDIDDLIRDVQGNPSIVNFQGDFAGILDLDSGIKDAQQVRIGGEFTSVGSIDLSGQDVAGSLEITGGGGGTIINGGAVSGTVTLADGAANTYSGSADFASVLGRGVIETVNGAHFSGTLQLASSSSGSIHIDGDCSGTLSIGDTFKGDVHIVAELTATGNLEITGMLGGSGRIRVDGQCKGRIKVGERTDPLTLILLSGGLYVGGKVEINTSEGKYNAEGVMHVGPAAVCALIMPDVTFDGCIRIYNDSASGHYGNLEGAISISGCHAPPEPGEPNDLNICIDGADNGNVNICQTNCPNQVGWSCNTCP